MNEEWGPLAGLIGEWEGEGGVDHAFKHSAEVVFDTTYREKCTMKPFGPVDNGTQSLYGLDYKSAMWRDDEEKPFHSEVGYWLWDAATGHEGLRRSSWHCGAGRHIHNRRREGLHFEDCIGRSQVRDRGEGLPRCKCQQHFL